MSQKFDGGPLQVFATGIAMASGAASTSATIPNMSSGELPRYIRVAASQPACVRLGKTSATAVTTDLQVQPGDAVILAVGGCDKIACIQVSVAGVVQVSPLENM